MAKDVVSIVTIFFKIIKKYIKISHSLITLALGNYYKTFTFLQFSFH